MPEYVTVKSGRRDNTVALWEVHPEHPDGEIFIAGDAEVQSARTRRVDAALKAGILVEVSAPVTGEGDDVVEITASLLETFEDERIIGALIAAGYDTVEKVRAASDEELRSVDGIGPKSLAAIRKALA